ncbi:MAG: flagellar hook basal-body protein [Candidatus Saganbacteria bacterium]|nr:flagellar hook basal-body protein [Candidatus Saganbacteria bacterium]
MYEIMNNAQNAIEAYNVALQATSSNIANMNVTGYKRIDVSFQSIFEQVLTQGAAAQNNMGGTNPKQFGQGMTVSNVAVDFSSGEYVEGSSLDLAISGNGLFIVSADNGETFRYTRAGNFSIDSAGNLRSNGMLVYGLNNSGNMVAISNLPSGSISDYQWQSDGTLEYTADGGSSYTSTGYRIALTYFGNPGGLIQADSTTFAQSLASGAPATAQAPGGAVGSIRPGELEQSNVFYMTETINAMELQNSISGNLAILQMASDMISEFISKLG